MRAAKCEAVVQHSTIGNIDAADSQRKSLYKSLPDGHVKGGVTRQVIGFWRDGVSIRKA